MESDIGDLVQFSGNEARIAGMLYSRKAILLVSAMAWSVETLNAVVDAELRGTAPPICSLASATYLF
jgi:hypothetical protein